MKAEQNRYLKTFTRENRIMKGTMGHENTFYHNVTVVWEELRVKLKTKLSALQFNHFIVISNKLRRRDIRSKEDKQVGKVKRSPRSECQLKTRSLHSSLFFLD